MRLKQFEANRLTELLRENLTSSSEFLLESEGIDVAVAIQSLEQPVSRFANDDRYDR